MVCQCGFLLIMRFGLHSQLSLLQIFAFEAGTFPSKLKKAVVVPIPKVNNPLSTKELKPISLMSALSKML